jgi:hypothetical protein
VHLATTANFTISTQTFITKVVDEDNLVFNGLVENTNYFVKLLAIHNDNKQISNELSFKTAKRDYQTTTATVKVVDATINSDTITTKAEVGDIVVSENGYLRKVVSTNTGSVETQPAKLRDVFKELSFSSSSVLTSPQSDNSATTNNAVSHIVRTKGVNAQGNITTKVQQKWQKTKFSITDNLASNLSIPRKKSSGMVAHSVQLQNENNYVVDGKLKITGARSVILNPGDALSLHLVAEITKEDKNKTVFLKNFEVDYFNNDFVDTDENMYKAQVTNDTWKKPDGRIYRNKLNFYWVPKQHHVSDEPYILTVKVKEDEDSDDYVYDDDLYYTVYIYVTNNNTSSNTKEDKSFIQTSADRKLTMESDLDIGFTPRFDVEGDYGITGLDYAKVVVGGTLHLNQDIIINASGNASLSGRTNNLIDKTFTKVVMAGNVPVVITGQFTLHAEYTATASAKLNITHDFDSSYTIEAGVEYDDDRPAGQEWQTFKKSTPVYSYKLTGEADAKVFGEVRLIPKLTVKIYEAAYSTISIEPYLNAEAEVEGYFKYTQDYSPATNFNQDWDADYRFTKLGLNGGVDVKLRLGLDIFENDGEDLIGYPSDDKTDFKVFKPIDNKPLYGLPTMSNISQSSTSYKDSRVMKLSVNIDDIAHPLGGSRKSLNPFNHNSTIWLSKGEGISFIYPDETNKKEVYMLYTKPLSSFTVKVAGNSNLGKFFRQYQTLEITDLVDSDSNNIPDYWENQYSNSDSDGLSYLAEFQNGTFPNKNDSDDDGMDDKFEVDYDLNPIENDANDDKDGDGFSNIAEFNAGTNPNDKNDYPTLGPPTISLDTVGDKKVSIIINKVNNYNFYNLYYSQETFTTLDNIDNCSIINCQKINLTATASVFSQDIDGLTNSTKYYFVATTVDDKGTTDKNDDIQSGISNEVSAIPKAPNTQTTTTSKLNDTGITWGGNYPSGNNTTCTGVNISAQDCSHGRDAQALAGTLQKVGGGDAGFDFTRLNSNGTEYTGSGNYDSDPWACVRDNVTGLVWEVKTDDDGIHDKDNTYRWGGLTAIGRDHPNKEGTYYDDWNTLVNGTNTEKLCGFNDWRVPTQKELGNITHHGKTNPTIDTNYFPNAPIFSDSSTPWLSNPTSYLWSSSPASYNNNYAWAVYFYEGTDNFANPRSGAQMAPRNKYYRVRLVVNQKGLSKEVGDDTGVDGGVIDGF